MRLRPLTPLLFVAVLLAPLAASAQVADADRATARALAEEGQDALEKKGWAVAADRFRRADAIVHAPTLLLGLGRAQVGLGRLVAAHETLSRIVREGVAPGAPPVFAVAVADAARDLDSLARRIPTLIIVVKGARAPSVTIDGAVVPAAALGARRPVDPGKHVIRATAEEHAAGEATVTLVEGKAEVVTIELATLVTPLSAAPPPLSPNAARSSLSGQQVGGIVALGAGAAGLVLGAVTGGLAVSRQRTLAGKCDGASCPASAQADIDAYHTMGLVSTVGFVAGGVAAAGGVILLLTAPKARPPLDARIAPVVGPGYLGFEGRF